MAKKKRPVKAVETRRYDTKALHEDREYGIFWYAWLWHIIRPVLIFLCSLLIIIGLVTTGYNKVYEKFFMPVSPDSTQYVDFRIESGTTTTGIGKKLVEEKLLRNAQIFKYMVQLQGLTNSISYGTYSLSPSMTPQEIIQTLSSGSQTNERTITIIPGWTCEDIADYLLEEGIIADRNDFLSLCNDANRFAQYSYALSEAISEGSLTGRKYALEGYLSPDTYRVFRSATAEDVIRKLLAQNNVVIDAVFYSDSADYTQDADGNYVEVERYQSTLTINQTLILASILEKEAANATDYARVSAVLHNRLNAGWRLESDPTATYLSGSKAWFVPQEDLYETNAYNTYQKDGLPAGAICNPSKAAIQAALYPDLEYIEAGYMFYCAAEPDSGKLVYAKTQAEHEANVAKYYDSWVAFAQ